MAEQTIGAKLLALKSLSGLSLANIAKAAGYKSASSIQRYFSEDYDAEHLPRSVADRLGEGLIGFGDPPINKYDIDQLTEFGFLYQRKEMNSNILPQRAHNPYIECNSTFGLDEWKGGAEIFLVGHDPIIDLSKPPHMTRRSIGGLYVSVSSLSPRYNIGEIIFYEQERPPSAGQDAVVSLSIDDDDQTPTGMWRGLLGKFIARERDGIVLEVFDPAPVKIVIPHGQIESILPVLRTEDFLAEWHTHKA